MSSCAARIAIDPGLPAPEKRRDASPDLVVAGVTKWRGSRSCRCSVGCWEGEGLSAEVGDCPGDAVATGDVTEPSRFAAAVGGALVGDSFSFGGC